MKLAICILATVLVSVCSLSDEVKKKLAPVNEECKSVTGVLQDHLVRALNGEVLEDAKLKDQALCVFKKLDLASKSGELNKEVIKKRLRRVCVDDEEMERIAAKCLVKKATPEETAYDAYYCISKIKPEFSPLE